MSFLTVGQQCFGISFWTFRNAGWEDPSPRTGPLLRPVEHAFRRSFPAPVGRLFLHIRAEKKNGRWAVFGISPTPPHGHSLIDSIIVC